MSTNETKVDVLAVMDELCMRFATLREMSGFGESELTPKANAARAAVAELIDANAAEYAAEAAYANAKGMLARNDTWAKVEQARAHRRAAFARCTGGKS